MDRYPLRHAAATRPAYGQTANGDGWILQERDESVRVVVIDGLGHGPPAARATTEALAALRSAPELDAVDALFACDRALRGTRGAGASVLLVGPSRATFAGVGNVEARVIVAARDRRLLPDRGVLGRGIRMPRPIEVALEPPWLALLHTDGVSSRFESPPLGPGMDIEAVAEGIVAAWGRAADDATILLITD